RFSLPRSDAAVQQCPNISPAPAFRQVSVLHCTKIYPSCNLLFLCQKFGIKMAAHGVNRVRIDPAGPPAGPAVNQIFTMNP
ncbi:MAG: hypothetical protein RIG67_22840, partial [Rhodospirillales bacterium]